MQLFHYRFLKKVLGLFMVLAVLASVAAPGGSMLADDSVPGVYEDDFEIGSDGDINESGSNFGFLHNTIQVRENGVGDYGGAVENYCTMNCSVGQNYEPVDLYRLNPNLQKV